MLVKGKMIQRKGYALLGKKVIPRGSNCFYLNLKNGYGLKVYYGLDKGIKCSENAVRKVAKRMKMMAKLGIATPPVKIKDVQVDVSYNGKKIKETCYAIKTRHLDMKYNDGKDRFKKKVHAVCKKNDISINKDSTKDVNIGYDWKEKRFKMVDVA